MFAARAHDPERPVGRGGLCKCLANWTARRRGSVHVVFDGPVPREGLYGKIVTDTVRVDFSGPNVSADDAIQKILEEHTGARHLIVVSSDREVGGAARRRGAKVMKSDEFWAQVMRDLSRPVRRSLEPPEKRRGLTDADTDRWLQDFGYEPPAPDANE